MERVRGCLLGEGNQQRLSHHYQKAEETSQALSTKLMQLKIDTAISQSIFRPVRLKVFESRKTTTVSAQ